MDRKGLAQHHQNSDGRVISAAILVLVVCALLTTSTDSYSRSQVTVKKVPQLPNKSIIDGPPTVSSSKKDSNASELDVTSWASRRHFIGNVALMGAALSTSESARAQAPLSETAFLDASSSETVSADVATTDTIDWNAIFQKAGKKALGGGKAGASASIIQVLSLMWLRTSMNYQYRYGGDLKSSLNTLWEEGGIPRLYQGLPFALVQGPLTRFFDTAANVGILALLESTPEAQTLPLPIKTAFGSISAGVLRIILMPIDASKTAMQVEGKDGLKNLWGLASKEGIGVLYQGALAQVAATAAGHFPWFLTFNFLSEQLPTVSSSDDLLLSLGRSALIGFSASCISDTVSNSLRVIKTTKQTARLGQGDETQSTPFHKSQELSYADIVRLIIEKDGLAGLFGRGLSTRLLTNSIQGAVFSVLWKYFQEVGNA